MNTSATGGFLAPTDSPAPLEDAALDDFFHSWICGISGLTNDLVRPRWQTEPANIPDDNVTWISFGITKRDSDAFISDLHNSSGLGYNETRRHEILHFLISCYGPNANNILHLLRDGMQVSQNREILSVNNMGLVESGEITPVPELFKDKWLYRADLPFSIRRQIVRQYPILNIIQGVIVLDVLNQDDSQTVITLNI